MIGEQSARAPDPGLHFIEQKEEVVATAEVLKAFQVAVRRRDDATLALDRLHQNRSRLVGDGRRGLVEIVEGDEAEALRQRAKAFVIAGGSRRRKAAERPSVKAVVHHDDLVGASRATPFPSHLDGSLVRLRAAVAKEDTIESSADTATGLDEKSSRRFLLGNSIEVRNVKVALDL